MRLEEYKRMRLAEVDYFLRGIKFENNGIVKDVYDDKGKVIGKRYAKIVENITINGVSLNAGIINRNKECHDLLEKAIGSIYHWRTELEDTDSELYESFPITKEVIDKAVANFIKKVMILLNELKNDILQRVLTKEKIKINDSFESSSLGFFEVNIGGKVFDWEKEPGIQQIEARVDKEQPEAVDSLTGILFYIYILPDKIKDSKKFKDSLLEIISLLEKSFKTGGEKHYEIMKYSIGIRNTRSKTDALKIFNKVVTFLEKVLNEFWDDLENLSSNELENNLKFKLLNDVYKVAEMYVTKDIALVALALGKMLHEQWAEDARKLYLDAEQRGCSPEECSKISSGVVRDGDVLRKWRPTKDDNFAYDDSNKTHDRQNKMVDIMNMPFEELPSSWKGTNLEAGLVAAVLVGGVSDFDASKMAEYIAAFAPIIHEEWMRRNGWEKDSKPELFVDYSRLTPEMQKLDDAHVIAATKLFDLLLKGNEVISVDKVVLEETCAKVREVRKRLFESNYLRRKV